MWISHFLVIFSKLYCTQSLFSVCDAICLLILNRQGLPQHRHGSPQLSQARPFSWNSYFFYLNVSKQFNFVIAFGSILSGMTIETDTDHLSSLVCTFFIIIGGEAERRRALLAVTQITCVILVQSDGLLGRASFHPYWTELPYLVSRVFVQRPGSLRSRLKGRVMCPPTGSILSPWRPTRCLSKRDI